MHFLFLIYNKPSVYVVLSVENLAVRQDLSGNIRKKFIWNLHFQIVPTSHSIYSLPYPCYTFLCDCVIHKIKYPRYACAFTALGDNGRLDIYSIYAPFLDHH